MRRKENEKERRKKRGEIGRRKRTGKTMCR